jgi:uncharacterized membrane protein YphA (DoxX/SURF4 family)/peroxiredoxin
VVSTLALIVRLVLAAVFAVAGTAKLADLQGSRGAVEGFGVPSRFAAAGGTILPLVELSIATGLLVGASARWAGACAIALLALFAVAMARSIARGDAPDCHCFGALHSRPVGKATLARTVGLGALAVFAVAQGPGTSATAWVGRLHGAGAVAAGAGVAAAVLVVIGGWVAVELLRAHGRLLQRVDALEAALAHTGIAASVSASNGHGETPGLPVGTPAPEFELRDVGGELVTLADLLAAQRPVLLVFTDPGCGPCRELLPPLAAWEREHDDKLTIAVVGEGDAEALRIKRDELELATVLVQEGRSVAEAYRSYGTPTGVLVSSDGTVASALAT